MTDQLTLAVDAVLRAAVTGEPRVPGVSAGVTDRDHDLYVGAAGVRSVDGAEPFTTDTVCTIHSCTKAVTGTAALQLVEEGRLDLDAPARQYAPGLGTLQVLDGFDPDGNPRLRPPTRDITTRMLLTHTAGFAYDFFSADYLRLAREHGQPAIVRATPAALRTPLLFDPGERWEYGSSIDWVGQVVEASTGRRLGDVLAERVLGPLGMTDTAFDLTPAMRSRKAAIHQRGPDGVVRATAVELPADPEVQMGGHGLWSTTPDYLKFIRMWLADGAAPDGTRVLRADTVAMAARNHLPGDMRIKRLPGVAPAVSNDFEFFPGLPKTWGLTFMRNDVDAPTGRPAGSLAWAGLANLYYWIDRRNGIGGFWATQLFPFADATSMGRYLEFETAVYRTLQARPAA